MTEQPSQKSTDAATENTDANHHEEKSRPNLLQIVGSTLAAAMGVQSDKNRERDFSQGSIKTYVIAGVIFTAVFVASLVVLVKYLLAQA